ncbi:glycosyltransferase family 2 protein [Panacibacter sp. DH6]|uniref:Glycosyltransferase family 2 protein n=1 Tax=Panacibacter microcysteis TaxID=2793269 RepID=A0A931E5K2_9BACT|nr:glycosyltransferase family A protein [Panacibacter microcysteis]MBG9377463.1 glycosyltransferase family 2 protein [Panacibacter microcysteis]
MGLPEISIILPTYNGAKFLKTSLDSCLAQTFTNFELIIVNDCSTDDTGLIADEYALKDKRIKVIHNQVNKKLPLSLNAGFDIATGAYHTWTSDDNYYAPNALETLYKMLKADESVGFIYTNYTIINNLGNITGKRTFGDINQNFTNFQGCSACFLYKAEIYKLNKGYNASAFLIEDYDFFVRAFLNVKVVYDDRYDLYYYREHEASLTATHGDAVNDVAKIMMERLMPLLEKKLPDAQMALVYRKFAVFNAVQKNNTIKYQLYLKKLWRLSKKQVFITIAYVPVVKFIKTLVISFKGLTATLQLMLTSK